MQVQRDHAVALVAGDLVTKAADSLYLEHVFDQVEGIPSLPLPPRNEHARVHRLDRNPAAAVVKLPNRRHPGLVQQRHIARHCNTSSGGSPTTFRI